jgi:pantoate kinase
LKGSRDVDEFLSMSYQFADNLGLTQYRCKEPLKILKSHGIEA